MDQTFIRKESKLKRKFNLRLELWHKLVNILVYKSSGGFSSRQSIVNNFATMYLIRLSASQLTMVLILSEDNNNKMYIKSTLPLLDKAIVKSSKARQY